MDDFGRGSALKERDPNLAMGMSLVCPGLGQLYNGEFRKGLLFQLAAFASYFLFAFLCLVSSLLPFLENFGKEHNLKVNFELSAAFKHLQSGSLSPFFLIVSAFLLLFIAYAAHDAFKKARRPKRLALYNDFYMEMPEACSSAYLVHLYALFGCFLLAFFILVPPPSKSVVTEFQFVENVPTEKPVQPTVLRGAHNSAAAGVVKRPQALARSSSSSSTAATPADTKSGASSAYAVPNFANALKSFSLPQLAAVNPSSSSPAPASTAKLPTPTSANSISVPPSMPLSHFSPAAVGNASVQPRAVAVGSAASPTLPVVRSISGNGSGNSAAVAPAPVAVSTAGGDNQSPTLAPVGGSSGRKASDGSSGVGNSGPAPARATGHSGNGPALTAMVQPSGRSGQARPSDGTDSNSGSSIGKGVPSEPVTRAPDYGPYMAALQSRIKRHWYPPKNPQANHVKAIFEVYRNGSMTGLRLVRGCGIPMADKAALTAIEAAAPFPPLPEGSPESITIEFSFDYNVFVR